MSAFPLRVACLTTPHAWFVNVFLALDFVSDSFQLDNFVLKVRFVVGQQGTMSCIGFQAVVVSIVG